MYTKFSLWFSSNVVVSTNKAAEAALLTSDSRLKILNTVQLEIHINLNFKSLSEAPAGQCLLLIATKPFSILNGNSHMFLVCALPTN